MSNMPKKDSSSVHSFRWIMVGFVLLILLVVAGFFFCKHLFNQESQIVSQTLATLQSQQQANIGMIQTLEKNQQEAQKSLTQKLSHLENVINTQPSASEPDDETWYLQKARFALELAELNAISHQDDTATLALLQKADGFLARYHHPGILPIRQHLSDEILLYNTDNALDIIGLFNQINAIDTQVVALSIHINPLKHPKLPVAENYPMAQTWQEKIKNSFSQIKQFFIIHHRDDGLSPLITPAYQALQREAIRFNLQEMQWAIVHQDPILYKYAVHEAMNTISRTFSVKKAAPLMRSLTTLETIEMPQARPIPTTALVALDQFIQKQREPS